MENSSVDLALQRFHRAKRSRATSATLGYTDTEIVQLARDQGWQRLPSAYEAFLRVMGRSASEIFPRFDIPIPAEPTLWLELISDLEEETSEKPLVGRVYIFLAWEFTDFMYFRSDEGDDPPVYYFQDADAPPVKVANHFSEYLLRSIDEWAKERR